MLVITEKTVQMIISMTGGLMQLVVYGAQDIYLTGNPMITFFKAVYRRHTNFATESIRQTFNGTANFDSKLSCLISRNGDLISKIYLETILPSVTSTDTNLARWVEHVGHHLIKEVEIEIGGQTIDRHTGEWLDIWSQLAVPAGKQTGYYEMIGSDTPECLGISDIQATIEPRRIYVPLQFWFCRHIGLALPLIALQYHEVRVNIRLAKSSSLVSGSATVGSLADTSLWVEYIYLDAEERRRFSKIQHEYLIDQLQITSASGTAGSRTAPRAVTIELGVFNHPVKELVWVVQNNQSATGGQQSNYTAVRANRGTTTGSTPGTTSITFESAPPADITVATLADITSSDQLLALTRQSCISPPGGLNPVVSAHMTLNGYDRFVNMPGSYFNWRQPHLYHTSMPRSPGINVYSFSMIPESYQPSGTCNFSRVDNARLTLYIANFVLGDDDSDSYPGIISGNSQRFATRDCKVRVYGVNYNVLRIMNGMGGLAYSH